MDLRRPAIVVLGLALAATPAAAEVQLSINGGRVSLSAKNATVGQILTEWARVGQTKIVNGERVPGGPVTLELTNVPEVEAIEILLRAAGGYLLAPRRVETANASRYDRILILPVSSVVVTAPRASAAPAPAPPRPFPQPPIFQPPNLPGSQPDDSDQPADRSNAPNPAAQNVRPPVFNTFPQPAVQTIPAPQAPTSSVTAPAGVAVPGMVVPVPQPAGQPGTVTPQPR
jgi:hypothetical protein